MSTTPTIRVGQIWESRDRRDNGRSITVVEVHTLTDQQGYVEVDSGARRYQMLAHTLRTRYRLTRDVPGTRTTVGALTAAHIGQWIVLDEESQEPRRVEGIRHGATVTYVTMQGSTASRFPHDHGCTIAPTAP